MAYKQFSSLVELLEHRATHHPTHVPYTFLSDGETNPISLSYADLQQRAYRIAAQLQEGGVQSGERVLLLYAPGLEYIAAFWGCLCAGCIAVPVYPPPRNRPDARLQAILASTEATCALTDQSFMVDREHRLMHTPALAKLSWVVTDQQSAAPTITDIASFPRITADTLAFLQYTSGSTSTPKGVMLTHRNLLHNLTWIRQAFWPDGPPRTISWLPPYHDMGLIGVILGMVYMNGTAVLMPPTAFLQKPVRWLQLISQYRADVCGAPNFAYDLCVEKVTASQKQNLDLSCLKLAFNGAETVQDQTMQRFAAAFAACGFRYEMFYPCYGLAEATLFVSGGEWQNPPVVKNVDLNMLNQHRVQPSFQRENTHTLVSCGHTRPDAQVLVVNPTTSLTCAPDEIGEIWIASDSVAQGYWHDPEATAATFQAFTADTGAGPFLRTGDLGFLHNGELFITGRLKELIIIRGSNHYPQDIEATIAQCHEALQGEAVGSAFSVTIAGEERLVLVHELQRKLRHTNPDPIIQSVRQAVAATHGLQPYAVVLVRPYSIPRTSSGKIQRRACRQQFLDGELTVIREWQQTHHIPRALHVTPPPAADLTAPAALQTWITTQIAQRTGIPLVEIDPRHPFAYYGLDSKESLGLLGTLSDLLNRELSPSLLYEYPSIAAFTAYLTGTAHSKQTVISSQTRTNQEPIAIVGIGCRFPQAATPADFWQLLVNSKDAITEVPPERWDPSVFFDTNPEQPGKMNTVWGGFLNGVDQFDPGFFGISPREAMRMDPQQRILLEVVWEALADAGIPPSHLTGSQTGVFIGIANNEYGRIQLNQPHLIDAYTGTSNALSIAANRISYLLDLHGPSVAVDTACSASLVAVHLACRSLQNGESTLAIAGGVNLILSPEITIYFSKAGLMAPDGRCKTFDARADGYVRSEGAGIVILKPLSQALADNDPIYALIHGSAVGHDGRTNGLLAPNPQAQASLLRAAYANANISPAQIQYVETHGTGTLLGDMVEAKALAEVIGAEHPTTQPCRLGAVKTNTGHLEAAAGIAGLIKTALSLKHRQLPPNLHFQQPNPHIDFDAMGLQVQTTLSTWPDPHQLCMAGVSAFGFGGTGAHVVLGEAPPESPREASPRSLYVLPISAHNQTALSELAHAYHPILTDSDLPHICYTAAVRRDHDEARLALVGASATDLQTALTAFLNHQRHPGMCQAFVQLPPNQRKLVFVFPGQGGQWLGMGRHLLMHEPVFQTAIAACEAAMRSHVDWSLQEMLLTDDDTRLHDIDIVQPAIFAIQVALAALWKSWGIQPDAVVGHSMGEVAAATVAGALTLEDAAHVICHRSRLLREIRGQGAMAIVELSVEEAEAAIADYTGQVSIAASNGPRTTVLAGTTKVITIILAHLEAQSIFCRQVKVDVASHSPQVDAMLSQLQTALVALAPTPPTLPFYSTVTTSVVTDAVLDAGYWARNLREPVAFFPTLQRLIAAGHTIFMEISPHPVLANDVQQTLQASAQPGIVLPSMQRDEDEQTVLLNSLGHLHAHGISVDWQAFYPYKGRCITLPSYLWQRESYWLAGKPGQAPAQVTSDRILQSAVHDKTWFWETTVSPQTHPYLADHQVENAMVLPTAVYIDWMLAAVKAVTTSTAVPILRNLTLKQPLILSAAETSAIQVVITAAAQETYACSVLSRPVESTKPWQEQAAAHIQWDMSADAPHVDQPPVTTPDQYQHEIPASDYYAALSTHGLQYGPTFQGIAQVRQGVSIATAILASTHPWQPGIIISPTLLDACLQTLGAALIDVIAETTFLPTALAQLTIYAQPQTGSKLQVYAHCTSSSDDKGTQEGDVWLLDETGKVLWAVRGLRLQAVRSKQISADWLYTLTWQAAPTQPTISASTPGSWIICGQPEGHTAVGLQNLLTTHDHACLFVVPGDTNISLAQNQYQVNTAVPHHIHQLITTLLANKPCHGIIYLWESSASDTFEDQTQHLTAVLHLVQALAKIETPPPLWLVTHQAQVVTAPASITACHQATLWGLGRTLLHEHPELHPRLIDLSTVPSTTELENLYRELQSQNTENQIVLRESQRFVARLIPARAPEASASATKSARAGHLETVHAQANGETPFYLDIHGTNAIGDWTWRTTIRRPPSTGEVEIRVKAVGLNFSDVLKTLGVYPGTSPEVHTIGVECAGEVVAIGNNVTMFQVGDAVMALAPCQFGNFVTVDAHLVAPKPAHLSFNEAAGIPIAFLTAHYALYHLGRLTAGERVLIHSASGGVGLAAVQLAHRAGATVFATAGTPDKRDFLHTLGIPLVMDSRSSAFADEIMDFTTGSGVDVILNSLPGEAITAGLSCLGSYGRFLELGKKDIYENSQWGMAPFRKNLAFFAIDLERLLSERAEQMGQMLREIGDLFAAQTLQPLPTTTYPVSQVEEAFRYMAQAQHTGKIVLTLTEADPLELLPTSDDTPAFRADATYLITGGFGGIGLELAHWLAAQGARHLALVGRHGAYTPAQQEAMTRLAQNGVTVRPFTADVTQAAEITAVLDQARHTMPPLHGVIHAAGILDDALLLQLTSAQLAQVMAPKVLGAWHLHQATQDDPLDFFILFSSAASVLGSPGQAHYAAGNAFLDALAYLRHHTGQVGTSISWGPWSQVGLAAAQANRGNRLALQGIASLSPQQGIAALQQVLAQPHPHVAVIPFRHTVWNQFYPQTAVAPLFHDWKQEHPTSAPKSHFRETLRAATTDTHRHLLLETYLQEQIAHVLRAKPENIDIHKPFDAFGLDSLMGLEIRNRLEGDLELTLSATITWNYPSITELSNYLLERLFPPVTQPPTSNEPAATVENSTQATIRERIATLSDEEATLMLLNELEEMGE